MNEITINGETYVKKSNVSKAESKDGETYVKKSNVSKAESKDGMKAVMKAVIVRTYSAGVFYGYLKSQVGREVELLDARRMWQWYGASLSECAQSGTPNKTKCKFPEKVSYVKLLEAIEILDLTDKALKSLDEVEVWKA